MKKNKRISLIITLVIILLVGVSIYSMRLESPFEEKTAGDVSSPTVYKDFKDWNSANYQDNKYTQGQVIVTPQTKFVVLTKPTYYYWATGTNQAGVDGYAPIPNNALPGKTGWYYWSGTPSEPGGYGFEDTSTYIGSVRLRNFRMNGGKLEYVITNSVPTPSGELLDAKITLDNPVLYDEYGGPFEHSFFDITHYSYYEFMSDPTTVDGGTYTVNTEYYNPLLFSLDARGGHVDFTISYGKYNGNGSDYNGTFTVYSSVNNTSALYYDLDISSDQNWQDSSSPNYIAARDIYHYLPGYNSSNATPYLFDGNEGYYPLNGKSTIFYDSGAIYNSSFPRCYGNGRCLTLHQSGDRAGYPANGIYVTNPPQKALESLTPTGDMVTTDGIYFQSTTYNLVDNISGSYAIRYGGTRCGIGFVFMSLIPYRAESPTETIVNEKSGGYYIGEEFTLRVAKYIPQNYFVDLIKFNTPQLYSNLPSRLLYDTFSIVDTIDASFNINTSGIKVVDENGAVISGSEYNKYFNAPTVTENRDSNNNVISRTVTATARSSFLTNSSFYGHSFYLEIPVSINKYADYSQASNYLTDSSQTVEKYTRDTSNTILQSNVVDTKGKYKIIVHHYVQNSTTKVAEDVTYDNIYTTSYDKRTAYLPTGSLSGIYKNTYEWNGVTPSNASGTISASTSNNGVVTINFYYRERTSTLTIVHCVKGSNPCTKVHADNTETVYYGDSYDKRTAYYGTGSLTTNYKNKYIWDGVTPSNANGNVSGDITIRFDYKLRPSKLTVHHYIEGTTTKLCEDGGVAYNSGTDTPVLTNTFTVSACNLMSEGTHPEASYYQYKSYTSTGDNSSISGTTVTGKYKTPLDDGGDTVIFYYTLKPAKLTVHHYIIGTNNVKTTTKLCNDDVTDYDSAANYPLLTYDLEAHACNLATNGLDYQAKNYYQYDSYESENETLEINGTDITGAYTKARADGGDVINYYYKLKQATITVHHYKQGTTEFVPNVTNDTVVTRYYGETYTASPVTESTGLKRTYHLVSGEEETFTVEGDRTITFYYALKQPKLRVYHLALDDNGNKTNIPVADMEERTYNVNDVYSWNHKNPNQLYEAGEYQYNFEYDSTKDTICKYNPGTGTCSDTVSQYQFDDNDVEVRLYYKRRSAQLIVHYYFGLDGTIHMNGTTDPAPVTVYYGKDYTTTCYQGNDAEMAYLSNYHCSHDGTSKPVSSNKITHDMVVHNNIENRDEIVVIYRYTEVQSRLNVHYQVCPGTASNLYHQGATLPYEFDASYSDDLVYGNEYHVTPPATIAVRIGGANGTVYTYKYNRLGTNSDPLDVEHIDRASYNVTACYILQDLNVTVGYYLKNSEVKLQETDDVYGPHESGTYYRAYYSGVNYSVTPKEFTGYEYVDLRPGSDPREGKLEYFNPEVKFDYKKVCQLRVKHVDYNTGSLLLQEADVKYDDGAEYTTQARTFTDYNPAGSDKDPTGIISCGPENNYTFEVTYKYKKQLTLRVEYLDEEGQTIATPEDGARDYGYIYTRNAKDIENYEFTRVTVTKAPSTTPVEVGEPVEGTLTSSTVIKFYYKLKQGKIIERYYNIDTNQQVHTENRNSDRVFEYTKTYSNFSKLDLTSAANGYYNYAGQVKVTDAGGNELTSPEATTNQASGTASVKVGRSETYIYYYYRKQKCTLTVKHLIYGSNPEESVENTEDDVREYDCGAEYVTNPNSYENYGLKETPSNYRGTMNGNVTVKYYYEQNTGSVTVEYLVEGTGQEIKPSKQVNGNDGDSYDVRGSEFHFETIETDNGRTYTLVRTVGQESGTIKGNTKVTHYYRMNEGSLQVRYIDAIDGHDIITTDPETLPLGEGYGPGTAHEIVQIEFENYIYPPTLDASSDSDRGTITGDIVVIYKYARAKVKLNVRYVDIDTNEEIGAPLTYTELEYGDYYGTDKTKVKDPNSELYTQNNGRYRYVKTEGKTSGYIFTEYTVTHYYRRLRGTVYTYYRDIDTEAEIHARNVEEYAYDEAYQTTAVQNIDYYTLDSHKSTDVNAGVNSTSGHVNQEEIIVTYYYKRQTAKLTVIHVDAENHDNILGGPTVTTYNKGTVYITSPIEVENYGLVATPNNYTGVITEDTTVTYEYYKLDAVVITKHMDEETKEILASRTDAYKFGDMYTTSVSAFENYEFSRVYGNEQDIVREPRITVIYYYTKMRGTVTTRYCETGTVNGEEVCVRELIPSVSQTYKYGENYETHREVIENYEYVSRDGDETGTVLRPEILVQYNYRRKEADLVVNYLEDGTDRVLKTASRHRMKYGEEYRVTKATIPSYDYVKKTGDSEEGIIDGNKTINYYYAKKQATMTVKYLEVGTLRELATPTVKTYKYGDQYVAPRRVISRYGIVSVSGDETGTIDGDVEVIFYYDYKDANVITKYLEVGTNNPIEADYVESYNYNETYVTEPKEFEKYELVDVDGKEVGVVDRDVITVTYYYEKKTGTITIKYLDEEDLHEVADTRYETYDYGDPYEITVEEEIGDYELVRTTGDVSGEMEGDKIVVFYYKKKEATLVTEYVDIANNEPLQDPTRETHKYGDSYETIRQEFENYEFDSVTGEESGTITSDKVDGQGRVVVTYYYKKKRGNVEIYHLEKGTNKALDDKEVQSDWDYGYEYETSPSSLVLLDYILVDKTDNYRGIVNKPITKVYYYYELKDSTIDHQISKVGTDEITSREDDVIYSILYQADIKDYVGSAKVTIVDELPYPIDVTKSDIDEGVYNPYKKTITWEETIEDIYQMDSINIMKNLSLRFIDYPGDTRQFVNSVTAKIKLSNNEKEITEKSYTKVSLEGNIIVHHYLKGTEESLFEDEEITGVVGDTYTTQEQYMEGYVTVTRPKEETVRFDEKVKEVVYEYERLKYNIEVINIGGIGEVTGNEEVFYGEDSTPNNIVLTPGEGYEIAKIIVNGYEYDVTDPDGMVLDNFIAVQENIVVEVEFIEKEQEVPITGAKTGLIIVAAILLTISLILIIKYGLFQKVFKR